MLEDVVYILLEDQSGPIENWLMVLKERGVPGADTLLNTVVRFGEFLEHCDDSYGNLLEPAFPLTDSQAELIQDSQRTFGVRAGAVIVFAVMDGLCIHDIQVWLRENAPKRYIAFLDYALAGTGSTELAKQLVPHLALSHSQLCVGSSSKKQDLRYPTALGLESSKARYFCELNKSLRVADESVTEALEFWKSHNTDFTGNDAVDQVVALFVRAYQNSWDWDLGLDGPFGHASLENPSSRSRQGIDALFPRLSAVEDDPTNMLKALFMCEGGARRAEPTKRVSCAALQEVINFLGIDASIELSEDDWLPPYHPGIVFLCQLRLLAKEFSDTKNGTRLPPRLAIHSKEVEFMFAGVNIAESRLGSFRQESKSSNTGSCLQLFATEQGFLDNAIRGAYWVENTAAACLRELFRPSIQSTIRCSIKVIFDQDNTEVLRIRWVDGKMLRQEIGEKDNDAIRHAAVGVRVFNKDVTSTAATEKDNDLLLGMVPGALRFSCSEFPAFLDLPNLDAFPALMIGHMTNRQLQTALTELGSRRGIIIRCSASSEGRRRHRHAIVKDVVVLELRPSFLNLGEHHWGIITKELGSSASVARKVVNGELPNSLQPFFGEGDRFTVLNSLSILCQGVLAIHANAHGDPEGVPQDDVAVVEKALTKMKWSELWNGGTGKELLVEELLDESQNGLDRRGCLRKKVRDPQFWKPLIECMQGLGSERDTVVKKIFDEEWSALVGDADWEPVQGLLREAWDSAGADLKPGNVARAFVQLAVRLGGA